MSAEPQIHGPARERQIFLAALQATPTARIALLDRECGDDAALRARIQALLEEEQTVGDFLETPAIGGTGLMSAATEKPGDRIGRYKLLQKIGEGGAGVVYMAEQEEPVRRRVALKVIKLGMDTKTVIARFEAERQALAMMDHPNIAKVLDAGATEAGRPFFVMELVRGIKITQYCDENKLSTNARLSLFTQVCQAIQHAHQKGVIHRDVKPSNILVTLHDGRPVPKVIDFGIVKATEHRLTEKTLFTEFTTFIGTPAYMSPEQAEMSGLDIDTRSDIYSLGVLLYELLTGKTPFDAEKLLKSGLDECRRTIREQEPPRPSTRLATLLAMELTTTAQQRHTEPPKLIHQLSGDLDWIVMKCLEKDRTRRYATANALAEEIQRYLGGEPIIARPPSAVYRFKKFVWRRRGLFAATSAVAITLLAGVAISSWQAIRATTAEKVAQRAQKQEVTLREEAERDRARAEQGEASARLNEYVADINLAQQSLAAGNYGRAVQLLNKHVPVPGAPDLRGFEWRYLWQLCQGNPHTQLARLKDAIQSVAFAPGGDIIAVGVKDKVSVLDLRSRTIITNIPKGVVSMAFTPDGKRLFTASPMTTRAWKVSDWSEQMSLPENSGPIALSHDSTQLATMSREGVKIWDALTGQQKLVLPEAIGPVAFAPDGKTLVTDSREGLTIWSLAEGTPQRTLKSSTNLFARGGPWFRADRVFAFSPDGKWLVAARNTLSERGVFVLSLWDTQTGDEVAVMPEDPQHIEHTGVISGLAFSPDGRILATASMDHSIRLWDLATRRRIRSLHGHLNEVWTLAFSPDGQTLVSGARDGTVKLWPLNAEEKEDVLVGNWQPLGFSRDSRTLLAVGPQNTVSFINVETREPDRQIQLSDAGGRGPFKPPPSQILFSADLKTVAQGLFDGNVKFWKADTAEYTTLKISTRPAEILALSPDGNTLLAGGGRNRNLRWWDLETRTETPQETEIFRALFSPDGSTFAGFCRGNRIEIWDVASRSLRTNIVLDVAAAFSAAFSPDSRLLAIVCFDDTVRLWDTTTARLLGGCTGHKQGVFAVAFSPDGKTLATCSDDSTLKFWNVATQQELLTIRRLGGALRSLVFSPDGRILVGGTSFGRSSGYLRFFHAPPFSATDVSLDPPGQSPTQAQRSGARD